MRERDYYRDKYDFDKFECDKDEKFEYDKKNKGDKDEATAFAATKAVAVNKNWNILCVPSDRYGAEDDAMRRSDGEPYDLEGILKKGFDGDDGREIEAEASGKAIICNKNVNIVVSF